MNQTHHQAEGWSIRASARKWHAGSTPSPCATDARRAWLGPLDFLEEQLWGLRDRIDALRARALPERVSVQLAVIDDEVADAALLLRRPTTSNRRSVGVLIVQLRTMLEVLEGTGWSGLASNR